MNIREHLKKEPLLFDGAFGTFYAARRCDRFGRYAEANLTAPGMVRQIAYEYILAGCNAIKTNTFGANRISLDCDGTHLQSIIQAACRIANAAAEEKDIAVFADIAPIPQETEDDLTGQYLELADLFLENGVTNFLFETQSSARYLTETAAYIKEKCPESFILITFAVGPDGFTAEGFSGMELLQFLDEDPWIDALGFNCLSGPYHLLQYLKTLPPIKKPLCISPNAGYPTVDQGITRFSSSPTYFARQMMEIREVGASILGGCCGTTPEHIHELALALHLRSSQKQSAPKSALSRLESKRAIPESKFWEKMQSGKLVVAAELDPPSDDDVERFMRYAQQLERSGVDAITLADCPVARVHIDSSLMAVKIKRELHLDTIPHMTCRDRNINAAKALLLGLSMENVRNILVVTGDPIPNAKRSEVKGVWSFNSAVFANYIRTLGDSGATSPFHVWGALNVNAANFQAELDKAKRKLTNGVCGFLTQPVFTARSLENLAAARRELPDAYILGGILPVVSYRAATYMNSEVAGIEIPDEVVSLYEHADAETAGNLAVEISCQLAREIRPMVNGYYLITPAGRPSIICRIMEQILEREQQ